MTDDDNDFMTMKSHKIRKDAYNAKLTGTDRE